MSKGGLISNSLQEVSAVSKPWILLAYTRMAERRMYSHPLMAT